jgi:hypothetical protein
MEHPQFGVFYTCYTEKAAVEYSLERFFELYPDVPVYLVSDGGSDYAFLEEKFIGRNIKTFLKEDSRGKIPFITKETFKEKEWQEYIKKSIIEFLGRVKNAVEFCNREYLLVMEPDVLVRGKITIPKGAKLLGTKVNKGLSKDLRTVLKNQPGAVPVNRWGVTPALFESAAFLRAYDVLLNNPGLLDSLCLSEYRLAYYDVLFAVLFGLIGVKERFNPEIVECYRNRKWETSWQPLVHQYRAKYPLSSQGYDGTHTKNAKGLGDLWFWKR